MMDKRDILADYHALEVLDCTLGRVTHKFSNLISPVLGFSEILKKMNTDEELNDFIIPIHEYSLELRNFNDLLGASDLIESDQAERKLQASNEAFLETYSQALKNVTGRDVSIHQLRSDPLQTVLLAYHAGALRLAMEHLIRNALEAGSSVDSLKSECSLINLDSNTAALLNLPASTYACFSLSGPSDALSSECLTQALTPLYTTKDVSRHKGLGLWHTYRLMRRMGGTVLLQNSLNQQSCAQLLIPASTGSAGG